MYDQIIEQGGLYGIFVVLLWQQIQNLRNGKTDKLTEIKNLLKDSEGVPISTTLKHLSIAMDRMTKIADQQTQISKSIREDLYALKFNRLRKSTPPEES